MSKQIFVSDSYEQIWERDPAILQEIPLLWLDYLALDNKNDYMRQLQGRHEESYLDNNKNLISYQVYTIKNSLRYLIDQCYRCHSFTGEQYIAGVSKSVNPEIWYPQHLSHKLEIKKTDLVIQDHFFGLLAQHFGIYKLEKSSTSCMGQNALEQFLVASYGVTLSNREMECLSYLCQGKTAKQTAKGMMISPRTVEIYLNNIRLKTECSTKLEVLSRFSNFFPKNV